LALDDPLLYGLIGTVAVIVCVVVVYAMRNREKKEPKAPEEAKARKDLSGLPFKIVKSIPNEDAARAKDELRLLDLERQVLSDAIRRLYEAQADGKITEEEREKLAQMYKSRIMTVRDAISKDESVVALHELEAMQEDLVKLFSERFDELNTKTEELRTRVEAKPVKEITIPAAKTPSPQEAEEKSATEGKEKRKRRPPPAKPSPRTEAEKRIEEIRSEVEKILDRLGQMEIES
jgi:hypothetical protein